MKTVTILVFCLLLRGLTEPGEVQLDWGQKAFQIKDHESIKNWDNGYSNKNWGNYRNYIPAHQLMELDLPIL